MNIDDSSDYALWVKLANDPNQSEESRRHYRERMESYIHRKLREALQFATQQTAAPPTAIAPKP
jgi:GTP1/Obg family GTP-binding protein